MCKGKNMWKITIFLLVLVIIVLLFLLKREKRESSFWKEYSEKTAESSKKYYKEIQDLNRQLSQYEYLNESLELFKFRKAIKIIKNNRGHIYIVMEDYYNNSLDFYLSGEMNKGIGGCPRILTTVRDKYIWIDDLFAIDEDCGNGSLLLECLFSKANELSISEIRGQLSWVDADHFDKLEYFYKKNGFNVVFNNERTKGSIMKRL